MVIYPNSLLTLLIGVLIINQYGFTKNFKLELKLDQNRNYEEKSDIRLTIFPENDINY